MFHPFHFHLFLISSFSLPSSLHISHLHRPLTFTASHLLFALHQFILFLLLSISPFPFTRVPHLFILSSPSLPLSLPSHSNKFLISSFSPPLPLSLPLTPSLPPARPHPIYLNPSTPKDWYLISRKEDKRSALHPARSAQHRINTNFFFCLHSAQTTTTAKNNSIARGYQNVKCWYARRNLKKKGAVNISQGINIKPFFCIFSLKQRGWRAYLFHNAARRCCKLRRKYVYRDIFFSYLF